VYVCVCVCVSELWWLEGHYHDRNKAMDTPEICHSITHKLREGIEDGSVVSSHVRHVGNVPVMFVHAGYRNDMIEFMKKHYSIEGTAEELSAVTNKALRDVVISQHEVYHHHYCCCCCCICLSICCLCVYSPMCFLLGTYLCEGMSVVYA
jgi:hypothetical protein